MTDANYKITPMFEQYLRVKADYPDALLFYRMGDFYELFFDDAVTASRELQIALTSRNRSSESNVPMCGVPWHSCKSYIAQLIEKGYKIAICDQTEDPRAAKGLVKRAVTRVITPGTVLEDENLDAASHNYLGALFMPPENDRGAFAWADISTGQWSGAEFSQTAELWQWVRKLSPRELLVQETCRPPAHQNLEGTHLVRRPAADFDPRRAEERVLRAQKVRDTASLGLQNKEQLLRACGALLCYMEQTQKCEAGQLAPFVPLNLSRRMLIDEVTERNLEIFTCLNGRKGKGTLRHVVDRTLTPMGARLLEDMLRHPWRERKPIEQIQNAVAFFFGDDRRRERLRGALKNVYDLERLTTRIALNRCTPHDFVALRNTLAAVPAVRDALLADGRNGDGTAAPPAGSKTTLPPLLAQLVRSWDPLPDCAALLESALADNPPLLITEGGLFKTGYNAELDAMLDLVEHGEQKLQAMLEKERTETGLQKLKLGYNRVFGYYYEISRAANVSEPPEHFIRRQTLANGERFTTTALKSLESDILSASEKQKALEYALFQELRAHVASLRERLLHLADLIAQLDYWQCLAETGRVNGWVRPELSESPILDIVDGRHPVVEEIAGRANFVPNSIRLEPGHSFCLLTGPNMAGKSTVLRQVALICLLAQMGSMVPATRATLGLTDRLFSRVGASDDLARGESTFMVEMMETARILRQSTRQSLVILDEIGRGTSTFDGLAIAWAVVEHLVKRADGALRTLFATHYHELTVLEGQIPSVFTMNIAIKEYNGDILFLHRLIPGPADRSYGVEVARLAGVPAPVVQRARVILKNLEDGRRGDERQAARAVAMTLPGMECPAASAPQPKAEEHPVIRALRSLDPQRMSPLDALTTLISWKNLLTADARREG